MDCKPQPISSEGSLRLSNVDKYRPVPCLNKSSFKEKPPAIEPKMGNSNSYNKMLTTFTHLSNHLDDLETIKKNLSFKKCILFSVDESDLSLENVKHWGNRHLSPLTLKSASACYQFPKSDQTQKEKEVFHFAIPMVCKFVLYQDIFINRRSN